jgi:hypothetical protein
LDAHLLPRVAGNIVVSPQEWWEGGVDGCSVVKRGDVPGVVVLAGDWLRWRGEGDALLEKGVDALPAPVDVILAAVALETIKSVIVMARSSVKEHAVDGAATAHDLANYNEGRVVV